MKPDLSIFSVGGVVWCPVLSARLLVNLYAWETMVPPSTFWEFMAQYGVF